jgi:hypothetical protein
LALELLVGQVHAGTAEALQRALDTVGADHAVKVTVLTSGVLQQREVRADRVVVDLASKEIEKQAIAIAESLPNKLAAASSGGRRSEERPEIPGIACVGSQLVMQRHVDSNWRRRAIIACGFRSMRTVAPRGRIRCRDWTEGRKGRVA